MSVHKLDVKWIQEQMNRLPIQYKQKAREGYERAWQEAYDLEPVEHKKTGAARRAANIRLRRFVDKVVALSKVID